MLLIYRPIGTSSFYCDPDRLTTKVVFLETHWPCVDFVSAIDATRWTNRVHDSRLSRVKFNTTDIQLFLVSMRELQSIEMMY